MKNVFRLGMLWHMNRHRPWLTTLVVSLLLAGCGTMRSSVVVEPAAGSQWHATAGDSQAVARTPVPGGSYVVAKGDTLYSIAFRNGVDFRDLAQWNGIAAPYTIWPGQRLMLSPSGKPHAAPAAGKLPTHVAANAASTAAVPVFEPVPAPPTQAAAAHPLPRPSVAAAKPTPHVLPAKPAAAVTVAAPMVSAVVPVAGGASSASTVAAPVAAPVVPVPPAAATGASRDVSGVAWRWPADGKVISRFKSGDAIPGIEISGAAGDPVRAAAGGVVVYSGNGLVGYGELVIIKHNDSFLSAYGHNSKRLVKEGQRVSAGQPIAEMGSTGTTRNELEFQIRKNGNPVDPLDYLPAH